MAQSPELPVATQIRQLTELSIQQLRERWTEMFKSPPPVAAKSDYLVRAMAYRIQEQAEVLAAPGLERRLKKLMSSAAAPRAGNGSAKDLRLGSWLLREWQGETHEVLVLEGGYRHREVTYKSLSQVARVITGTRWSGPLFFGLKVTSKQELVRPKPTFVVDLSSRSRSDPAAEAHHGL